MAQMNPILSDVQLDQLPSKAEAVFYRACREKLPKRVQVIHSISWVNLDREGTPRDGEADFVILDPEAGILVVEVKGGGVGIDASDGQWVSIGRDQCRHKIKDPFKQATSEKYSILGQLKEDSAWQRFGPSRVVLGHAVFLPDIDNILPLASPQRPIKIMGGKKELSGLAAWVSEAFNYWQGQDTKAELLGEQGLKAATIALAGITEVRPSVRIQLEWEEEQRIKLTSQQAKSLRLLGTRRRAAICGGAGTGKTILALTKARELAAAGLNTLLLCYNRPLADHLQVLVGKTDHLMAMNFHQLCDWRAKQVKSSSGRDLIAEASALHPGGNHFDTILPQALCTSLEAIDDCYDAIVIDEAQDFSGDYWVPLEMLLRDVRDSYLYIFYDQNQAVYGPSRTYPVLDDPFVLTVNCRNTRYIHSMAYQYFDGDATEPSEIDGVPVHELKADGLQNQAKLIHTEVSRLLREERVGPHDIVVLIAGSRVSQLSEQLKTFKLPPGVQWAISCPPTRNQVLVDSVRRFKGLECTIAFIWGLDDLDLHRDRGIVYVGTSRAKSRLYLVGSELACSSIMKRRL